MEGAEGRECLIELQLIPRRLNVIVKSAVKSVDKSEAKSAEKSISLFPVRELPPSLSVVEGQGAQVPFDLDGYLDRWMERFKGPSPQGKGLQRQDSQRQGPQAFSAQGPSTSLGAGGSVTGSLPSELQKQEQKLRKEKLKKEQLIGKLEIDEQKMKHPWAAVGQYIIAKQSLDVPDDWKTYVDFNLPLSANIQNCFDRHKAQEKSRLQVIERINHLKQEIDELSKKLDSGDFSTAEKPIRSLASELLGKAKAKGRKKILADQVEAVFGKSAQDNMALLRKAQPWDLWVHVKDLPSAHLFIRRPRGKQVDHHLILEAARWCLENPSKEIGSGG
jgi:phage tail tube protein FII